MSAQTKGVVIGIVIGAAAYHIYQRSQMANGNKPQG